MLTKEDKFQKTLKLYTMVVEAGLTWGINDDNDITKQNSVIGKKLKWYENKYVKNGSRPKNNVELKLTKVEN